MDIYRYLESNAIKDHWEKIGFMPDPLQSAYLIFSCDNHSITLKEKQDDYRELLKESENYIIKPRPWFTRECSLDEYLSSLLDMQDVYIKRFFTPGDDVFYTGKIYVSKYNDVKPCNTYYFKTFEELKESYSPLDRNEHIVVSRCVPGYGKRSITLSFNHDFEIAGIGILGESADGEDADILFGLNAFYFDFPYPFKRFDIVYNNICGPKEPLLIIDKLQNSNSELERLCTLGDDTDMCISCIVLGEDKGKYTHNPLLNLDYYDETNYEETQSVPVALKDLVFKRRR